MTDDLHTVTERLDATARTVAPTGPPADLWTRGRRARRRRQVTTGLGAAAAAVALVVPAAAVAGLLPSNDRSTDVAGAATAAPALPDTLYAPPSDVPRERAPGPLTAAYEFYAEGGEPSQVAGVSAVDGRTVVLPGVPATIQGSLAGGPHAALSPDGVYLAYLRGPGFEPAGVGADRLVVRDLRTGEDVVTDLKDDLVARLSGLRPMSFTGDVLMVSIDHAPGQSLHAVDPATGEVTTLVRRGGSLTFPGPWSSVPTFTVDRRVYLGEDPAAGRQPAYRGPRGYSLGPAAVSPDGARLAAITTELYDGTAPEDPELIVMPLQPRAGAAPGETATSGGADVLRALPRGGEIVAWLPDGRIVVRLPDALRPGVNVIDEVTWLVVDPGGSRAAESRVIDTSEIDSRGILVAADAFGAPVREAIDPSPIPVAAIAGGAAAAGAAAVLVVWRRRRRAAR